MNIYQISYSQFKELLLLWDSKKAIPEELFIARYKKQYFALNNKKGNAFVEVFSTLEKALLWLVSTLTKEEIDRFSSEVCTRYLKQYSYNLQLTDGMHIGCTFTFL